MRDLISDVKQAVKYWWLSLIVGILALIVGVWSLFTPLEAFAIITILFVVTFFVEGAFEIIVAISSRKVLSGWGWSLALGIIDIIFGIILLSNMAIAPLVLSYVIAFWVLFRAIWGISVSIDIKKYGDSSWGWLLALSILGILLSFVMLIRPLVTIAFTAYFIGFALIFYGIFRIYLGIRLKSFGNKAKKITKEIEEM